MTFALCCCLPNGTLFHLVSFHLFPDYLLFRGSFSIPYSIVMMTSIESSINTLTTKLKKIGGNDTTMTFWQYNLWHLVIQSVSRSLYELWSTSQTVTFFSLIHTLNLDPRCMLLLRIIINSPRPRHPSSVNDPFSRLCLEGVNTAKTIIRGEQRRLQWFCLQRS
jgi:hypothetical protein